MKFLRTIFLLFSLAINYYCFSQSTNQEHTYIFSTSNSETPALQKEQIDILRTLFNTLKCNYDSTSGSFIITTKDLYDVNEMKVKIQQQGIIVIGQITTKVPAITTNE